MFPIINLGPLALQAAGFFLLVSLFIGTWLTSKLASGIGANADAIETSILVGLLAGILGARIGFFLKNPALFMNDPFSLFSLTPSMLDASFGILVGVLTAVIIAQNKHLPLWPTMDALTPLFIAVFCGIHLANYANGNAFGLPTSLPWGIELWGTLRHPVQLYAVILAAALLLWLLVHTQLLTSTGFLHSGTLFGVVLAGLALNTLFTQAFAVEKILLGELDFLQLVSLLIFIGALALISNRAFPARKKVGVMLSMGSNQNPALHLSQATQMLSDKFRIRRQSSRYRTEDVSGDKSTPAFINQVVEIETDLAYEELRAHLKSIEGALGREPGNKKQVTLDLDILTYGNEVFTTHKKHIPAPDMLKYTYIARPLAEMSPDFRHPANGLSIERILAQITDQSAVIKISEVENGTEG
jgi:2-amino-4-hydroxy-6-hydroxymethyldihydropteridine diphosphokinase